MRRLVLFLCFLGLPPFSASSPAVTPPRGSALAAISAPTDQKEFAYVASRHSDKFHLPTCRYVRQIKAAT